MHWSNGTALPLNPCTLNTSGTQETANQPPRAFIHFAVEAEQPLVSYGCMYACCWRVFHEQKCAVE